MTLPVPRNAYQAARVPPSAARKLRSEARTLAGLVKAHQLAPGAARAQMKRLATRLAWGSR